MTHTWGDGEWNDGIWGGHVDYVPILQANWPLSTATPTEGDVLYDIFRVLDTQLGELDLRAAQVRQYQRLDGATDDDLEELAQEVGLARQDNESDDRLRLRTKIRKAGTRSEGTAEDIAAVLAQIFGEDDAAKIGLVTISDKPVVGLQIPQSLVDSIPMDTATLESELEQLLPASDAIQINTGDVWVLGEGGDQGVGEGELV